MPKPKHPPKTNAQATQAPATGDEHSTIYQPPTKMNQQSTADSRQPIADSCSSDEINLLDYFRVIYKYKWMIMIMTILAMGATVAYSLSQPRMYQANTSIVPPIDSLSQGCGLASKLGGAGSMLLQGMLNEGDLSALYVGILESRVVSEVLIDEFDLLNVYRTLLPINETLYGVE